MAGDETPIWYFAYGSNMSYDKFSNRRGIHPLASARVLLPGWKLTFEVPGMPYSEPGMSSITPIDKSRSTQHCISSTGDVEKTAGLAASKAPTVVHGRAYLITPAQLVQVVRSEGGGIAYTMEKLPGVAVGPEDAELLGGVDVDVFALVNVPAMSRTDPEPLPSKRYKGLLLEGAREAGMPQKYIDYLQAWQQYEETWRDEEPVRAKPQSGAGYEACREKPSLKNDTLQVASAAGDEDARMSTSKPGARMGALVFLAIFTPLLAAMEKLCYTFIRESEGECPYWVKVVVRWAVWWIWFSHDVGFAPIFGPGDGRDQRHECSIGVAESHEVARETSPLLRFETPGGNDMSSRRQSAESLNLDERGVVFWSN